MSNIHKINNIPEFIRFVADVFDDEFDYCIDYVGSLYYFAHGGCYELAKIIKHYFKDTEFVVRNDHDHCAILYKNKIYDIYDGYSEEELRKMNINEEEYNKKLEDFKIFTKEEIDKFERPFGRNILIEGKEVDNGMIDEINNISSIKVGF